MESTKNKNIELGKPELPAESETASEPNSLECLVTFSGAVASNSLKLSRLGKRTSKWSHNKNNILWQCYIRSITPLPTGFMKRMRQLWVEKRLRELSSQWLAVQVRKIKRKNILSRVEREGMMADVSD